MGRIASLVILVVFLTACATQPVTTPPPPPQFQKVGKTVCRTQEDGMEDCRWIYTLEEVPAPTPEPAAKDLGLGLLWYVRCVMSFVGSAKGWGTDWGACQ